MAEDAGVWIPLSVGPERDKTVDRLVRFAELVAAAERERCALECEARHANGNYKHDTREECAAAIRALGESK